MRSLVVVGLTMATAAAAHAETLGAWTYTAPSGFQRDKRDTLHDYTRIDGQTFCKLGVFVARPAGADEIADVNEEWKNLVASKFTASEVVAYPKAATKQGLSKFAIGAKVASPEGTYYAQLVVIRERGTVGSVLVLSNSAKTIGTCHPAMATVTESIAFAPSPSPAPTPTAVAPSLVGRWAGGSSTYDHKSGMQGGSIKRQYTFKADGTYAYHAETWFGHFSAPRWWIVDETGAYRVDGATLKITPSSTKGVVKDDKGSVVKTEKMKMETTTYAWQFHYFEGLKDNQLVLTPPSATARDGAPGGSAAFPTSMLYSSQYNAEWRYP